MSNSTHKFKIGDKVRCVDAGGIFYISNGHEYTVTAVLDEHIVIENDGGENKPYYAYRFELVKGMPEYVIVQGKAQDVVAEVEQYLKQGYKLQGGVSMHQDWFAQALVLNEPC